LVDDPRTAERVAAVMVAAYQEAGLAAAARICDIDRTGVRVG
jgi:hypothetical protein